MIKAGKTPMDKRIWLVALLYFLASALVLYKYGIQLGGEAEKYIDNANRIIGGRELRNGFFGYFYLLYSLLVAFFVRFSIDLAGVAVVQVILSFVSGVLLSRLLFDTLKNKRAAFIFFVIYLFCYPLQKWNFYLYSEGLHNSLLVIGVYLFHRWQSEPKWARLFAWLAFLPLILLSRPTGLIFIITISLMLVLWLYQNKKRVQALLIAGLCIGAVIVVLYSPLTAFVNPDSIRRMEVICQVPETNQGATYEEFNRQGLSKVFSVIKNEVGVGHFLIAGIKKLGYFFGMYRPYYSWQNNLLMILFALLYPFALLGIFTKQPPEFYYMKLFAATYIFLSSLAIFITCDDWANRFISPVFIFVLILAAGGMIKLTGRRYQLI